MRSSTRLWAYSVENCFAKRASLEHVAEADASVARELLTMTTSNLQHAENHMLLLGRKTSLERVAAFVLEMDRRLSAAGVMALPMSRRDIADYLGLTLETVSRALSSLHEKGFLDSGRDVLLREAARAIRMAATVTKAGIMILSALTAEPTSN